MEVKLQSGSLEKYNDDMRKLLKNGGPCSSGSLIEIVGDAYAENNAGSILLVARSLRRIGAAAECISPGTMDASMLNSALDGRGERQMVSWRSTGFMAGSGAVHVRNVCRLWMQVASDILLKLREAPQSSTATRRLQKGGICAKELTALLNSAAGKSVDALAVVFGADRTISQSAEAAALRCGEVSLPRCGLRHWWSSAGELAQGVENAAARASARAAARDDGDPHGSKAGKGQRARLFADWLVSTFGADRLRAGGGVLDVGGGRGEVAFELFNKRGIACVLVEPRARGLSREQHRWLEKAPPSRRMLCEHRRELFDVGYACGEFSLVVGMHADEATEPIVDAAIAAGVPFAVVPCCVFPKSNPDRRGPDGRPVTTTKEFVAYLRAKAGGIRTAFLPFEGRNVIVFSVGYSAAGSADKREG